MTLLLYYPCLCCHSFLWKYVFLSGVNLCSFFIIYFYLYCHWRLSYQEGRPRFGIPLTCLTLPHFCACPKPGPGFPTSYAMVFFVLSELRWEARCCWYWWNWWSSLFWLSSHKCNQNSPIKKPADLAGILFSQMQPKLSNLQISKLGLAYYTVKWAKTLQFTNQPSWLVC